MKTRSRSRSADRRRAFGVIEALEGRSLMATVAVNAAQPIRAVDTGLLGVNLAWWDSALNTAQTAQMVEAAGLTNFRFPGGSSSDDFHFNAGPSYAGQGTDPGMASFIASVGGRGVVTLDYGSGSPQEAAAFLAYLDGSTTNATTIGVGQEWSDSAGAWRSVDWKTAGYWASLRAASPLATDDGLNFLRIGRSAPFGFDDFEVGNEVYGSWETDHHAAAHDPATYVAFAKQFEALAATIDPSISVGLVTGTPGSDDNDWIGNVLRQAASQGVAVGFLSDHSYVQAPGAESDSGLLLNTTSQAGSIDNWSVRAADYQALLNQYLGAAGKNVELLATEFNSVYSNPGKQTTSLVNGLFVADSLGGLLDSGYDGADVWDLRNGFDSSNNNSSSLYGWRQGGDYGLLGSGGSAPSTGTYTPYPSYFAEQLASKVIKAGGSVLSASSGDPNLSAYAVAEAGGDVALLVVNKSPSAANAATIQFSGFTPSGQATVSQYGQAQDNAQSQTADGHAALSTSTASLAVSGSSVSYTFPAYSMTVLDLAKGVGGTPTGPTIVKAASTTPSPVVGTSTTLAASASDPAGASSLTYTWSVVGTPPAAVAFSANGTNGASTSVATFSKVGSYTFQVVATDPAGLSATSRVTVAVNPTLAAIVVSPGSATVTAGGSQAFAARGLDQFGAATTIPGGGPSWSAVGVGSIGSTGVYAAPASTGGAAKVTATAAGVSGSATVTVTPPAPAGLGASVSYVDQNDWGSGFVGAITITNTGSAPINGWTLAFTDPIAITSIWDATIASQGGGRFAVRNASWDATIAPGQSVSFGFVGAPGRAYVGPTGYVLNGVSIAQPTVPLGPISATAAYAKGADWGTGLNATITITNTSKATLYGWTLAFDFAPTLSAFWGASLVSHVGTRYVVQDLGYDGILAPGQSATIGFNAAPGGSSKTPANYALDGVPIGGGGLLARSIARGHRHGRAAAAARRNPGPR